jgi:hypothetical protein
MIFQLGMLDIVQMQDEAHGFSAISDKVFIAWMLDDRLLSFPRRGSKRFRVVSRRCCLRACVRLCACVRRMVVL